MTTASRALRGGVVPSTGQKAASNGFRDWWAQRPQTWAGGARITVGHLGQVDALQHRDPLSQVHLSAAGLADVIPAAHPDATDPIKPRQRRDAAAFNGLAERNRSRPADPESSERFSIVNEPLREILPG